MCALAIIIHILSHPSAEGQCLCADFHCPNWCAVVKFSVSHTEEQMGTLSQKGVAVTLVRLRMSASAVGGLVPSTLFEGALQGVLKTSSEKGGG